MSLPAILSDAKKKKICVIGDMMIDSYRVLKASRLSPEAPVIIYEEESTRSTPGGAGNVAMNLYSMGVEETTLCSVVGGDWGHVSRDVQFHGVNPVMRRGSSPSGSRYRGLTPRPGGASAIGQQGR